MTTQKEKQSPLEQKCPALTLPQRHCFFKEGGKGECKEESRSNCSLWKEYGTLVQEREYTPIELAKARRMLGVEMRRGNRGDTRNIIKFQGSYSGYDFEGEFRLP